LLERAWKGGAQPSLGALIAQAGGLEIEDPPATDRTDANNTLQRYGIKVVLKDGKQMVSVANAHQGLAGLFRGTHWDGRSGTDGVWRQALQRVPGAFANPSPLRFNGPSVRNCLVPLWRFLGDISIPGPKGNLTPHLGKKAIGLLA